MALLLPSVATGLLTIRRTTASWTPKTSSTQHAQGIKLSYTQRAKMRNLQPCKLGTVKLKVALAFLKMSV
jgi:hypothetical protein